jgi:hypothetical protein
MTTKLDIGIDLDGFLNIFIPRQTQAPFETANHIKLSNVSTDSIVLKIYEGVCIQNHLNRCIKEIQLDNIRDGIFLIQMKLMEKNGKHIVRVMSDDIILDDLECVDDADEWLNKSCDEDNKKRDWYNARSSFNEFVDNAHQFLNDDDVKPHIRSLLRTTEDRIYFEDMMKQLKEAVQVVELCDDVNKEEYEMMLEEITGTVNPFISQIQKVVKREKIN